MNSEVRTHFVILVFNFDIGYSLFDIHYLKDLKPGPVYHAHARPRNSGKYH